MGGFDVCHLRWCWGELGVEVVVRHVSEAPSSRSHPPPSCHLLLVPLSQDPNTEHGEDFGRDVEK